MKIHTLQCRLGVIAHTFLLIHAFMHINRWHHKMKQKTIAIEKRSMHPRRAYQIITSKMKKWMSCLHTPRWHAHAHSTCNCHKKHKMYDLVCDYQWLWGTFGCFFSTFAVHLLFHHPTAPPTSEYTSSMMSLLVFDLNILLTLEKLIFLCLSFWLCPVSESNIWVSQLNHRTTST